jgi:hypothetical protein
MKLSDWIRSQGVADRDATNWAADAFDLTYATARRIIRGERLPDPDVMRRIVERTRSAVTPNDFYDLESKPVRAKRRA